MRDPSADRRQGNGAPRRPRLSGGRLAGWATGLVLGLTALAVGTILALTIGPRFLPYQTYVVVSGSMAPTIPVGAIIVLRPARAEQLQVGDIITFQRPDRPGELVTHRIVGVAEGAGERGLVTKGDANAVPDPWPVAASGTGWRYVFALPYLGTVLRALQQPVARLLLLVVPALALGALTMRAIWSPRRGPHEEPPR